MAKVLTDFWWKSMKLTFMHSLFHGTQASKIRKRTQMHRSKGKKKAAYSRNPQMFWGDTGSHTAMELELKFIVTGSEAH